MNIEKAIEIIKLLMASRNLEITQDEWESLKLGIEALEWRRDYPFPLDVPITAPLPGETEE